MNGSYSAATATMLSETLYEASLYWKGGAVWEGGSGDATARSGGNYVSPITHQCQKNFNIILTDGGPTFDNEADTFIEGAGYINRACDSPEPGDVSISSDARDGRCLDDARRVDHVHVRCRQRERLQPHLQP
jgi:hypothetical protein